MSGNFPDDILTSILVRLPFDSLFRFRCVSKPWRDLIDSSFSYFVNMHRRIQTDLHPDTRIQTDLHPDSRIITMAGSEFYTFRLDSTIAIKMNSTGMEYKGHGIRLAGSCNGIICLSNEYQTGCDWTSYFVLWNPFTATTLYSEHLTSPPHGFNRKHQPDDIHEGFVYDNINDDYKLVRWHSTSFNGSGSYEVCIYSLKHKSWRTIKGGVVTYEAHEMHLPDLCAFANGAIHWIMKSSKLVFHCQYWILAFDIVTHKFRKIPFPCVRIHDRESIEFSCSNDGDRMTFSGLNGCLCLCLRSFGVHIWVMSEYGVESSWTNLTQIIRWTYSCNVVAYSEKIGKLVLQPSHDNPVIYDINTKSSTDVTIDDDDNADDYDNDYGDQRSSCICVGSFASPW